MGACAAIVNDWIDATDWMPRIHSHEDVSGFYRGEMFDTRAVFVACEANEVVGFIALQEPDHVTALFVAERRRNGGIGKKLLDRAKQRLPGPVYLWTFVSNERAQGFYRREGFGELRRTSGDNEESLPDILFAWNSATAVTAR